MLLIRFLDKISFYYIFAYPENFIKAINLSFVNTAVKNENEKNFDFSGAQKLK